VVNVAAYLDALPESTLPEAAPNICEPQNTVANSIRLVGEIWQVRYGTEEGYYKKNLAMDWLVKLLTAPNKHLTVADLRGDPEGKLAAAAILGRQSETDLRGLAAINRRLQEIDDIAAETAWTESLEDERGSLLSMVEDASSGKVFPSELCGAHNNIATQLRSLVRKLEIAMPELAGHLKASLKLCLPDFRYSPAKVVSRLEFLKILLTQRLFATHNDFLCLGQVRTLTHWRTRHHVISPDKSKASLRLAVVVGLPPWSQPLPEGIIRLPQRRRASLNGSV